MSSTFAGRSAPCLRSGLGPEIREVLASRHAGGGKGLSVSAAADSRKADQDLHGSGIADHSGGFVVQRHGAKPELVCNSLTYKNLSFVFHIHVSEAGQLLGKALPGRDGFAAADRASAGVCRPSQTNPLDSATH